MKKQIVSTFLAAFLLFSAGCNKETLSPSTEGGNAVARFGDAGPQEGYDCEDCPEPIFDEEISTPPYSYNPNCSKDFPLYVGSWSSFVRGTKANPNMNDIANTVGACIIGGNPKFSNPFCLVGEAQTIEVEQSIDYSQTQIPSFTQLAMLGNLIDKAVAEVSCESANITGVSFYLSSRPNGDGFGGRDYFIGCTLTIVCCL